MREIFIKHAMEVAMPAAHPSLTSALSYQDPRAALAWLEKACDAKGGLLPVEIAGEPRLDPLRSEPRFQNVMKRMNLAP